MRACVRVLAVRAVGSFEVVERGDTGETRDEELLRLRHEVKVLRAFKAAVQQQQQVARVQAPAGGVAEGVPPCPLCGKSSEQPQLAHRHRGRPRLSEQEEREKTAEPEEQPADRGSSCAADQVVKEDGLPSAIAQVVEQYETEIDGERQRGGERQSEYAAPASPAIESVTVSAVRSPLVDEADAEFMAVRAHPRAVAENFRFIRC